MSVSSIGIIFPMLYTRLAVMSLAPPFMNETLIHGVGRLLSPGLASFKVLFLGFVVSEAAA